MQSTASWSPARLTPWQRWRGRFAEKPGRADLWRTFWLPFWFWSDAPPPELPRREGTIPDDIGLAGQAVVAGVDRFRRRLWLSHAAAFICRGIWIGLLLAAVLMAIDALGGPAFNPWLAGALGGVLLLAGVVLAAASQPSRLRTVRMLDRSFLLQERLTTALGDLGLGVPAEGGRAPVVYLQMADAANAVAVLRGDRRLRPAIPVREVALIVIAALLLTTIAFARGLGGGLPEISPARVPIFTPALERPDQGEPSAAEVQAAAAPPSVQEVLEKADRSSRARRDLQALADALRDHAPTSQAAEQIAAGNYQAAGDQLRQAAAQASDISPDSREGLSDDLEKASQEMEAGTNGLQEATQQAAEGLQQSDQQAKQELRDLADAVEKTGQDVTPQSELASQMRSAQQAQPLTDPSNSGAAELADAGDPSSASAQAGASSDPGSGADAVPSDPQPGGQQAASSDAAPGDQAPGGQPGQQGGPGENGQANNPGNGDANGQGAATDRGQGMSGGQQGEGSESQGDAAQSQQGGGAGTGESGEADDSQGGALTEAQVAGAQAAAAPNVSNGNGQGGEGESAKDPNAGQQRLALPASQGDQGVQTSSDGGSALRGSGAGVTAGSGFATQGDVGEAGPDSNRVPEQHRDTVERYFGGAP